MADLDVPVDNVVRVAPGNRLYELADVVADHLEVEAGRLLLEDLEQVLLHVFKHQVLQWGKGREI